MRREASEKIKGLFLLFRQAVENERRAQRMYAEAIQLCEDAQLRKLLEEFHRQEIVHEEVLIQQYNQLRAEYALEDD